MSVTTEARTELSRLMVRSPAARKAQVSALLRFAGGLHVSNAQLVVSAELDLLITARRLHRDIHDLFGHIGTVRALAPSPHRRGERFLMQVTRGAETLARQTGLLDLRGQPVRGMPVHIVNAAQEGLEAAWRGAFLAQGALVDNGRSRALEVNCPGPEAALALAGAARRLGVQAQMREVRGNDLVVVRDQDGVAEMLHRMGALETELAWTQRRRHKEPVALDRQSSFGDVNRRRSEAAAATTSAKVARALDILGTDAPEHLALAGRLRIAHPSASLDELGRLAQPPMSKDTLAGRIRRLITVADRAARQSPAAELAAYAAGDYKPSQTAVGNWTATGG